MSDLIKQLSDYRLTTAEILYHMPDYPDFLQSFIWQEYDLAPRFPVLHKFLEFWDLNLDGKLHSVQLTSQEFISTNDFLIYDGEFTLQ